MKRLVIAPHVDDDVLGCGGSLDADTVTLYCGVDSFHVVDIAERRREAEAVAEITGGRFIWPGEPYYVGPVNDYAIGPTIRAIEGVLTDERPDEVLIPWPSYNQDHRTVYEAALVALRPHDTLPMVERVLVYEQPHVAFWDHARPGATFSPTFYRPIDVERKLALYAAMPSQVRPFRSPEHVRALARLRGGAIGVEYAEAFEVLRIIDYPEVDLS